MKVVAENKHYYKTSSVIVLSLIKKKYAFKRYKIENASHNKSSALLFLKTINPSRVCEIGTSDK